MRPVNKMSHGQISFQRRCYDRREKPLCRDIVPIVSRPLVEVEKETERKIKVLGCRKESDHSKVEKLDYSVNVKQNG